jgi:glycerate kinase
VSPGLCAPDSFKGTLSAAEVAAAMARGLRAAGLEAEELPLADGGEGTMGVLVAARGGEVRWAPASDPLGRPIEAPFALLDRGQAVVEVAAASGLTLVEQPERNAWIASSRGTGELIAAAAAAGAGEVLVAAGGSASTDGGAGALEALEEAGGSPRLVVLCDVRVPFERAPSMFGPQKGADRETVLRLERRLDALAAGFSRDPRGVALTGAAGGLAGGLWAERGAELVEGAPRVLDEVGFDRRLERASLVLTGEGRLDRGTAQGKLVAAVARRCAAAGVRCRAIVGSSELVSSEAEKLGLASFTVASTPTEIERAAERLGAAAGGG